MLPDSKSRPPESASRDTLKRLFARILLSEDSHSPSTLASDLDASGWEETNAPPLARLHRRIDVNKLNTVNGILTREMYRTVFLYQRASKSHHAAQEIDGRFLAGKVIPRGFGHNNAEDLAVFVAEGASMGGQAPDWKYSALWAFDHDVFTRLGETSLINPERYAELYNGQGPTTRTPVGNYNGSRHYWKRSDDRAEGAVFRRGAYGRQSGHRLHAGRFLRELLPGFGLPDQTRLYCAERYFINYN